MSNQHRDRPSESVNRSAVDEPNRRNGGGLVGARGTETYESLNIEPKPLRPHILAAATVVFGDDYYTGRRETINLSGFVQLNKWPMEGFNHRVDENGYAEFDMELISAPEVGIKGFSYTLNDRIQVLSNPYLPNTGHVRQIVPGQNFPAQFFIRRFGVLETSTMRLAHRNVIAIDGVIDGIPPYKKPLSPPLLGAPLGDGPGTVVPAPNTVRGVNLPEAWYPANRMNQAVGITPTVFFAESLGPCISTLVDPSMIIQSTVEGRFKIEVDGRSETVEIHGDHHLAAGSEILLFGRDKHGEGDGTLSQLARIAMVGNCVALGGRVMLRVSFFKVSGGSFGEGHENEFEAVRFPAAIRFDTHFEIVTPNGALYGATPVYINGVLNNLEAVGSELKMEGSDTALINSKLEVKARLVGVHLVLRDSIVGREAMMTDSGFAPDTETVSDLGRNGIQGIATQ
ncbi:DUF6004 family protein [Bradyrhizobium sp. AUGA SZCCT0431]|uniref:DUF6004 family protein n=1 Tax=Bradyrhizobium sp. AUGA SZCCT0431 TaxID=2807674 RepID=UPI001BA9F03D|nr:DUF6004 family protein [Bradyrhizobium sp. AUGA SZCCT0431]MBR1147533.1 hypothetical protein [Bradyrhizobium sp. AUGA SZCCT0431]